MPMQPFLPPVINESLSSYIYRFSMVHYNMHFRSFLNFVQVPQDGVVSPNQEILQSLEGILGLKVEQLKTMTFCSLGNSKRTYLSEEVHSEFCNYDIIRFCPQCLLEDGCDNSGSMGVRTGRIFWRIEHVRTCPEHGILLFTRKKQTRPERLQLMSEVAPDDAVLRAMLAKLKPEEPSDLQDYILSRLRGQKGPAWLDGQPIDLAAKACEMLGIVILFDVDVNLPSLTQSELHRAGHVGFSYASRGEEGLKEAFNLLFKRFKEKKLKGAQQKVFGKLYKWLQFKKNAKPVGPIKDVLREYILDHFPIPPGEELLGQKIGYQRVHSVHSLARKMKVHVRTTHRILVEHGYITSDPDKLSTYQVFDASEVEQLILRAQQTISTTKLSDHLNCGRTLAEQLVRREIIKRPRTKSAGFSRIANSVYLTEVDNFLAQLTSRAKTVAQSDPDMVDMFRAAQIAYCSVFEIVQMILDGELNKIQIADPRLKVKSVLVDAQEVRACLASSKFEGYVNESDACRLSCLSLMYLTPLSKKLDASGHPYVRRRSEQRSDIHKIWFYNEADLRAFTETYISLAEIARSQATSTRSAKARLKDQNIDPVIEAKDLGRIYYLRSAIN